MDTPAQRWGHSASRDSSCQTLFPCAGSRGFSVFPAQEQEHSASAPGSFNLPSTSFAKTPKTISSAKRSSRGASRGAAQRCHSASGRSPVSIAPQPPRPCQPWRPGNRGRMLNELQFVWLRGRGSQGHEPLWEPRRKVQRESN